MAESLSLHPIAALFPHMSTRDFAALTEDIRLHGVKAPILVHGGLILDGRHRYEACAKLGIPCPTVEWNGYHPWFEVQSRNLVRRHLKKDQIYAIRLLAEQRFPHLAFDVIAERNGARQRKAQAKGQPRGRKALSGSWDPHRTAEVIGARLGISASTVKRVERLARVAPELLPKVAAGKLSAKRALREALPHVPDAAAHSATYTEAFHVEPAVRKVQKMLTAEWNRWPAQHRPAFLAAVNELLKRLGGDTEPRAQVLQPRAFNSQRSEVA